MSVVMVLRFPYGGIDIGAIHDEVAAKVNELAKSMGAIHHDIYLSRQTNEVVVIDEWPSADDANAFWATDTFREALGGAGMGPPSEVYVLEHVDGDPAYRF